MTEEQVDEMITEIRFNAEYLKEKYDLDSIGVIFSKTHGLVTEEFMIERGSSLANAQMMTNLIGDYNNERLNN